MMKRWLTKDGRLLDVNTMGTDHIKNCVAMLEREGYVSVNNFYASICAAGSLGGEMASMAAEQEIDGMKPTAILDTFYRLLEERKWLRHQNT